MGRRVFSQRCGPESVVYSPQSAVHSHYVVRFDASFDASVKFLLSRVVIAMFWKAKISFSLVKNIVFPRLQNMDLVWTQK